MAQAKSGAAGDLSSSTVAFHAADVATPSRSELAGLPGHALPACR